jgi:hypothetical protein
MGTTPIYGFPYPDPSDLVANYPALGQQLAEDIEDVLPTLGGLAPITPTSIANSGGSASTTANTTTFSGVSSISLNGVFTTTYDNYRVVLDYASSTTLNVFIRYRTSGTDNTGASYQRQSLETASNVATAVRTTNQTSGFIGQGNTSGRSGVVGDIITPQTAAPTVFINASFAFYNSTAPVVWPNQTAAFSTTTQFDGFSIFPDTGNITGTISVYGYKK